MQNKDKKIIKKSALVVADQIVSNIPALNIAWGLGKALFGAGMELRQERVLEFVEMIQKNPNIFIEKILNNKNFQDGFVYLLEKYIRERNEEKRRVLRNVFLGFTKSGNKDIYPLEKMTHTTTQLSELDIEVLKDVDVTKTDYKNYQVYGNEDRNLESIFNLINLGILLNNTVSRLGPVNAPFVNISEFGRKYIEYLKIDMNKVVLSSQYKASEKSLW